MIPRRKAHIINSDLSKVISVLVNKNTNFSELVSEWERVFADFIGVKYAIAVSSGRSGLELILRSLRLNAGDEIIVPAYTLKDLIPVIQRLHLIPVLVDVELGSFNISSFALERKITKRTKVIIATHIFGMPCEIDVILEIAKKNFLFVVEDCAHSVGAEYKGGKTGSFGCASFFSFESMKPVNTYGGGMVVTNDSTMANKIKQLISGYKKIDSVPLKKIIVALTEDILFSTPATYPLLYLLSSKRWNSKLSYLYRLVQKPPKLNVAFTGFQALVGLEKMKTLKKRIKQRQVIADYLKLLLCSKIRPQEVKEGVVSNYYFFVVLLPGDVWKVRKFLLKKGIDAGIESEITDNCGKILGYDCPNTKEIFRRAIQLPLYEGLSERQICYIADVLKEALS